MFVIFQINSAEKHRLSAVQPNLQNDLFLPLLLPCFYFYFSLIPLHCINFIINKFSGSLAASVEYPQVYELINMPVRQTNSLSVL